MKQEIFFLVSMIFSLTVMVLALREFGWETGRSESQGWEEEASAAETIKLHWWIFSGMVIFIIAFLIVYMVALI